MPTTRKIVADAMGALRLKVGKDLGLTDESKWAPLWVIDFPMFEDDGEGGLTAMHHPFTSPKDMTAAELKAAPEKCGGERLRYGHQWLRSGRWFSTYP
ncbi:hypothetical protein ACP0HM_08385 [Escherichia coli]